MIDDLFIFFRLLFKSFHDEREGRTLKLKKKKKDIVDELFDCCKKVVGTFVF